MLYVVSVPKAGGPLLERSTLYERVELHAKCRWTPTRSLISPMRSLTYAPTSTKLGRVIFDVLPAPPARRRHLRQRLAREAERHTDVDRSRLEHAASFIDAVAGELMGTPSRPTRQSARARLTASDVVEGRRELRARSAKLQEDAMFELQVLVRVQSRFKGRADGLFVAVLGALEIFSAANEFRVSGLPLLGGVFLPLAAQQ